MFQSLMANATVDRPNILVIMTDQHSKHVLGSYGDRLVRTPNLDRLASEGLSFDAAYCPSPVCVPSRMSFMSSRLPSRNRVLHNQSILSSSVPTWATELSIAGYETALIGRMHFQGPDQHHGFERRVFGEFSAGYPGSPREGGPGFTVFPQSTTGQNRSAVEIAGRGIGAYQAMDLQVTARACSYLMNREYGQRPFAAVVGYLLPHCPFVGEAELYDYYYDRVDIPGIEQRQPETVTRFRRERGILGPPIPEERIRVARAAYYAMCESVDAMIGRVLDALQRSGQAEHTLVVYTSDHGEMAGEHGCWWKSSYYEGSVGIPLIARMPRVIPEASRTNAVANLMDLGPTFVEVAGADPMALVDGRSLLGVLQRPSETGAFTETTSELVDRINSAGPIVTRMIRSGRFKYWRHFDGAGLAPALFDLESDPDELNDLALDPSCQTIRETLDTKLLDHWNPEEVERIAAEEEIGFREMTRWGRAVCPPSPYLVPMPPPQFDEQAELR